MAKLAFFDDAILESADKGAFGKYGIKEESRSCGAAKPRVERSGTLGWDWRSPAGATQTVRLLFMNIIANIKKTAPPLQGFIPMSTLSRAYALGFAAPQLRGLQHRIPKNDPVKHSHRFAA